MAGQIQTQTKVSGPLACVTQIEAHYAAKEATITEPSLLIRINRLFRYGMTPNPGKVCQSKLGCGAATSAIILTDSQNDSSGITARLVVFAHGTDTRPVGYSAELTYCLGSIDESNGYPIIEGALEPS